MRYLRLLLLLALAGVALSVGIALQARRGPAPAPAPDTVYVRLSAESRAVADGTVKTVTRVRTFRDTITVTDTLEVIRFLHSVDTLLVRCDECAAQLAKHRAFTDSAMTAKDDSIAKLHAALRACRGGRPWWALGGLVAGGLVCRAG